MDSLDLGKPLGATVQGSKVPLTSEPDYAASSSNGSSTFESTPPQVENATHDAQEIPRTSTASQVPESAPTTVTQTATGTPETTPAAVKPTTSTIDPNVPASESAPTALPTNPAVSPKEQAEAAKDEHPSVIGREVEKTKAAERELKGEPAKGTVVSGIEDDRLWTMLRRFDEQINHVLHPATHLPRAEPDLRRSTLPNLPPHTDTLMSNFQRLVAVLNPAGLYGAREVMRLMSWSPQERVRTGSFCFAYFTCWFFGYAVAGVCSFFIAIICFPSCRRWFFPPIQPAPFTPPSATDPTNQKGDESLLGKVDSKVGHRSKAEQAEEQAFEAASILQAFTAKILIDGRKRGKEAGNSAVGEKDLDAESDTSDSEIEEEAAGVLEGVKPGEQGTDSSVIVVGGEKIVPAEELSKKEKEKLQQREAKRKRDELVSKMTKVAENSTGDLADLGERLTNALSPPSCYPDRYARFKIAGAFVVPVMFAFTYIPAEVFARSATFLFGVFMWGQPILIRAAKKFVELVPNWQELFDLRNSILSGVPTDQQLTLHLLRVAEALHTPLPRPPPPPLQGTPKEAIKETTPATLTAEDDVELAEGVEKGGTAEVAAKRNHRTKALITNLFQKTGKKLAGFHGDVSVDGSPKASMSQRIGQTVDNVVFRGGVKRDNSIIYYPAKYDGISGTIVLEPTSDALLSPQISFVPKSGTSAKFTYPIDDIVEIKKAHVSMTRMALGWASGADIEGLGLTIRFKTVRQQMSEAQGEPKTQGVTMKFSRVEKREQLFVRLVSMGRQRWEVL